MKRTNATENTRILRLVTAAMCLALCMVLPLLTGQIPEIGSMLCPMHLPVLLCGFLCGPLWAGAVGFAAPLVRFVIFGMPPLMPTALAMAFEMAAYGAAAGVLYRRCNVYVSLVGAMIIGRLVWGVASWLLYAAFMPNGFSLAMFWAGGFVNAWPGMVLQLVVVPLIVTALKKAKLI